MGQVFLQDNIPSVVKASTTSLTLAATNNGQPTRITVGGQQYVPASTITLSTSSAGVANGLDTGTLGAIQLWYVYAIVNSSSFALAMVASQASPSTGPTMPGGYGTAYKLIGAFYTDGSNLVGSVVPITGTAKTGWMSYTPTTGGGFDGAAIFTGEWRRDGDSIQFRSAGKFQGAGTAATVLINQPVNFTVDETRIPGTAGDHIYVGSVSFWDASAAATFSGMVEYIAGTGYRYFGPNSTTLWTANTTPVAAATDDIISHEITLPVTGWTTTLL